MISTQTINQNQTGETTYVLIHYKKGVIAKDKPYRDIEHIMNQEGGAFKIIESQNYNPNDESNFQFSNTSIKNNQK